MCVCVCVCVCMCVCRLVRNRRKNHLEFLLEQPCQREGVMKQRLGEMTQPAARHKRDTHEEDVDVAHTQGRRGGAHTQDVGVAHTSTHKHTAIQVSTRFHKNLHS